MGWQAEPSNCAICHAASEATCSEFGPGSPQAGDTRIFLSAAGNDGLHRPPQCCRGDLWPAHIGFYWLAAVEKRLPGENADHAAENLSCNRLGLEHVISPEHC